MGLDFERARRELAARGVDLRVHARLGSTQAEALALAAAGAPAGTVVLAAAQDAGRGRFARAWVSPEGGLYLSLILRPGRPRADWPSLGLVAALAALDAVEAAGGPGAFALKWPNDLLLARGARAGRKLAGILASVGEGAGGAALVVGVGLNLMPGGLPPEGAALGDVAPGADGARVLVDLLAGLVARAARWEREGPGPQLDEWWRRAGWAGRRVRVQTDALAGLGPVVEGAALGLTARGVLRLRLDGGREIEVDAGDASVLDGPVQRRRRG